MNNTEMQNPWRKLNDKILCLSHVSYVYDSVLACAKSAHVFQKLTRFADFVSNNSSSDSLCFIAFLSSPTAVPCLLLAVQYYTVGIPSEPLINDSHKCLCSTEKLQYRMLKSLDHTHYRYVRVMYMLRVMEMYMETFHIKKMADLHVVTVML